MNSISVSMLPRRGAKRLACLIAAVWATALPLAQADQINLPDRNLVNVTISGYQDGTLYARQPDGTIKAVQLADTSRLVVDTVGGLADFNEAERYFEQGQCPQAIARYERALRLAQGIWSGVILHRLVQACDGAGRVDRAGTYFMKLAEQSPRAAATVMPRNLPKKRTGASRRLVDRLHAKARQGDSEDRRVLLELFAYAIMRAGGQPEADARAAGISRLDIPMEVATRRVYAVKIAALQDMAKNGRTDSVLISVEAALNDCPVGIMADLLMLKGRVLLDRQADRDDLLAAGLCFMKVAIHFPDDPRAAHALYWAARVHDKLGLPDKSAQLLSECLAHSRIDDELQSRAQAELDRVKAALAG
ncbi:MAG: hypothetical protein ACE5GE_05885 [Phycisphaerae bacterium]